MRSRGFSYIYFHSGAYILLIIPSIITPFNWAKKSRAKNLSRDSYEVIISLCFVVHVGPGGYLVQKTLRGCAANMGSKISLLVYERSPVWNAKSGIWMGRFFKIWPNLSQNWLKFKKILEKIGNFVQNLAQNWANWYMNGLLKLVFVWVYFQIHGGTKTKLEYSPNVGIGLYWITVGSVWKFSAFPRISDFCVCLRRCYFFTLKGPYADHILIPPGSTGSSVFFGFKWKPIFFLLQIWNFTFKLLVVLEIWQKMWS